MTRTKADVRAALMRAEHALEQAEEAYDASQSEADLSKLHEASREYFRLRDEFQAFLAPR
jgi:hypothetical protein